MKNLGKALLIVGTLIIVFGITARLLNAPFLGSKPSTIFVFANSCFLLAIGLLLAEEKR